MSTSDCFCVGDQENIDGSITEFPKSCQQQSLQVSLQGRLSPLRGLLGGWQVKLESLGQNPVVKSQPKQRKDGL